MESINNQTPARSSEEQLKAKYGGKLYRVGITVPVDDESEKEFSYYFKRPTVPSYDRYIKTAAPVSYTHLILMCRPSPVAVAKPSSPSVTLLRTSLSITSSPPCSYARSSGCC